MDFSAFFTESEDDTHEEYTDTSDVIEEAYEQLPDEDSSAFDSIISTIGIINS